MIKTCRAAKSLRTCLDERLRSHICLSGETIQSELYHKNCHASCLFGESKTILALLLVYQLLRGLGHLNVDKVYVVSLMYFHDGARSSEVFFMLQLGMKAVFKHHFLRCDIAMSIDYTTVSLTLGEVEFLAPFYLIYSKKPEIKN